MSFVFHSVAAENLHPRDVPHLPGHEEGQQSISEPDQDKKDNSSATNADPKRKKPASQCATLRCCTVFMINLFVCTCIIAVVVHMGLICSVDNY